MYSYENGNSYDSTMTTENNEQEQQQREQEQHEQHDDINNIIQDYNNNYISHGAGRVRPDAPSWKDRGRPVQATPQQFEKIREAYVDNVGPLTAAVARMIERALDHGLTVDEVLMAIEETGFAPRPSAWYLRAILEAWAENGVTVSKIRHLVKPNAGTRWWKN